MAERQLPDFDSMTFDEIVAWKAEQKQKVFAEQETYRQSNEAYHRLVQQQHVDEATKQITAAAERSGRTTTAQAHYWLDEENAADPGHRIQAELFLLGKQQGSAQQTGGA